MQEDGWCNLSCYTCTFTCTAGVKQILTIETFIYWVEFLFVWFVWKLITVLLHICKYIIVYAWFVLQNL